MPTITIPAPDSPERSRMLSHEGLRRRALARLYERRDAVEELIAALENYERSEAGAPAECVPIGAWRRDRPVLDPSPGRRGLRSCRREVAFDGELDQAYQVVDPQFAHQAGPVGIDRLRADIQQIGDVLRP